MRNIVAQLIKEISARGFQSHTFEPVAGDIVINDNPECKHRGSMGVVRSVQPLPNEQGKTAAYECINSGDNWDAGDVLTKTLDQLVPAVSTDFADYIKNNVAISESALRSDPRSFFDLINECHTLIMRGAYKPSILEACYIFCMASSRYNNDNKSLMEYGSMRITRIQLRKILREALLAEETKMLPIMVNTYEDLEVMNRVANYALTNDIAGAMADENVNYENLDLDLDNMSGWVDKVGKDDGSFSKGSVVPDNWDLDAVYDFMEDLEEAWGNDQGGKADTAHLTAPNVKEREVIGQGLSYSYASPEEIKGMEFQIRRKNGKPSNINIEDDDAIGNITADQAQQAGFTLDDIVAVLIDNGAKERKKQKPIKHTPPMYD